MSVSIPLVVDGQTWWVWQKRAEDAMQHWSIPLVVEDEHTWSV
jgi:hypothetical protein